MQIPISRDAIIVSDVSIRNENPRDIVDSNISFLNALFDEYLSFAEVSANALRSYFVDYYPSI